MTSSVGYYGMMGFVYLSGLYIYVNRIPEIYFPKKFDLCGQSHNIWHILIIVAIVVTYIGA